MTRDDFDPHDQKWIGMQLVHQALHRWAKDLAGDPPVESVLGALALFVAEVHIADNHRDLDAWVSMLRTFAEVRARQVAN